MCGLIGVVAARGVRPGFTREDVERARDRMAPRGPDGAGLWQNDTAIIGHRRLVIVDPSPAAAQPMVSADGRFVLAYNGEIYNDADLRADLSREGQRFTTRSDTETVLRALTAWGPPGLARLRGMYALALLDTRGPSLLLARDALGIKPLYYRLAVGQLAFASQASVLASMPGPAPRPDLVTVSAYLTTIRTTLGDRTLYEGIRTLRPGESLLWDCSHAAPRRQRLSIGFNQPRPEAGAAADAVRASVIDSVRCHLRSDVPLCCLLSGGLDSAIVASIARREAGSLRTYCAGAPDAPPEFGGAEDFAHARLVAGHIGADHTEVPVTRDLFAARWPEMIAALGQPLSTPNEVAINEVSRCLRSQGFKVALSGEGADELFGGYEAPMLAAADFESRRGTDAGPGERGRFQLTSNAWMTPEEKAERLHPKAWTGLEHDATLSEFYESEFAEASHGCPEPLSAHLRFHRRVNLAGLLARLDTAAMLQGVEGRTPLADARVAALAESLPMSERFTLEGGGVHTKRVLRRAFAADLPAETVARPKASFPLPFQAWVADHAGRVTSSALLGSLFHSGVLEEVARRPSDHWRLAWPMINLAMWAG
ncbi:MAG: asparagine synthase (glutamine-hydrolyzing) [Phycisphaerales bacterium]|nr:asparagine synthase (glutamine-hydrolyzing) [Phycisphaerales bacterium]